MRVLLLHFNIIICTSYGNNGDPTVISNLVNDTKAKSKMLLDSREVGTKNFENIQKKKEGVRCKSFYFAFIWIIYIYTRGR